MGTPVHDQRDFRVTIRLTEAERVQLLYQMDGAGYLSISKYIRTRCLDGKSALKASPESAASNLRSQVNVLSSEIARIGANYNQTVRDFKRILSQTKRDGTPIVNNKTATMYLQQLNAKTLQIKALMENIISVIESNEPGTGPVSK